MRFSFGTKPNRSDSAECTARTRDLVGRLLATGFLPPDPSSARDDASALLLITESGAEYLVKRLEDNYVPGRVRRIMRNGNVVRGLPLFSPASVYPSKYSKNSKQRLAQTSAVFRMARLAPFACISLN